jgi:hypothetical protein
MVLVVSAERARGQAECERGGSGHEAKPEGVREEWGLGEECAR